MLFEKEDGKKVFIIEDLEFEETEDKVVLKTQYSEYKLKENLEKILINFGYKYGLN